MGSSSLQGRVLVIAGSDSGGGAGIQADIKTVTALGGYAATAITAVTDQNTQGVHGVHIIPADFVGSQVAHVLTDIGADVIKTGMLPSVSAIETVARSLKQEGPAVPRVVDPVMVAKGGHKLIADDAITSLVQLLVQGAAIITPNLPEAEVLTGRSITSEADMAASAESLMSLGADAVLLKGGHLEGDTITDLLITKDSIERFTNPRIESTSTHGTGCTLASAVAVGLAQGKDLLAAVSRARHYVLEAIRTAPGFGTGHGPLNHVHGISPGSS